MLLCSVDVLLTLNAASVAGELGSAELARSPGTTVGALPMTRMSNGSSAAASGSASGSEPPPGAATGPGTRVSSDSSNGSPFAAVAIAPRIMPGTMPGLPGTSNRVLEGLDSLSRIGVEPPTALGAEDEQSLKGLTAVRVTRLTDLLPAAHLLACQSASPPHADVVD